MGRSVFILLLFFDALLNSNGHYCSVSSPIDLISIVDTTSNSPESFERVKEFLAGTVQNIPEGSTVSIITADSWATTVLSLKNQTRKYDAIVKILNLDVTKRTGRRLNDAFVMANNELLGRNGKRNAARILILTTGQSTNGINLAAKIEDKNTPIAVIEVNSNNEESELETVGSYKRIATVDMLDAIALKDWVLQILCPPNKDLMWNRSFVKITPSCQGTEVCAYRFGPKLVRLCLCHDEYIGRYCGTEHPYGDDDNYRCYSKAPRIRKAQWEESVPTNFTGLRPCFGIELCAVNDEFGVFKWLCSCRDPMIGDVCSEEHSWPAVGRRCHFSKQRLVWN